MIYTCYEMIRDCREGRPEGWRYFVATYVPVIRRLIAHYRPDAPAGTLEAILGVLHAPQSALFQSAEPSPERWFVAQVRQTVLALLPAPDTRAPLELATLASALAPLTLVEKQAVWFETMGYAPAGTGVLLRMAPATVEKIRAKAGDLLRAAMDSWSASLLAENGRALGTEAAAAGSPECLPAKPFLDLIDGRTTWRGRDEMEQHVHGCWHCIDHFCRLVEVVELLRGSQALDDAEAAPFRQLLGIPEAKRTGWKRWLGT